MNAWNILPLMVIMSGVCLSTCGSPTKKAASMCKTISISSAGTFQFDASRILAIAHGSGGLNGVANYVLIAAPAQKTEINNNSVAEIILMADVKHTPIPTCKKNAGDSVSCLMSLSSEKLNLVVKYNNTFEEEGYYRHRTAVLASEIHEHVLGCR